MATPLSRTVPGSQMGDIDKTEILAFARTFQNAYRSAALYGADHASARGAVVQSYGQLTALLKQNPRIVLGFVNNRAMLNTFVVKEPALSSMEGEFERRGIGMVRFNEGVTMENFERVLAVISTKVATIEEIGGIEAFVRSNPIELAQVVPTSRFLLQGEDSIMDLSGDASPSGLQSLDMLAKSSGQASLGLQGQDVLTIINNAIHNALTESGGIPPQALTAIARILNDMNKDFVLIAMPPDRQQQLMGRTNQELASEIAEDFATKWAMTHIQQAHEQEHPEAIAKVAAGLAQAMRVTDGQRLQEKFMQAMESHGMSRDTMDRVQREVRWASMSTADKAAELSKMANYTDEEFQRLQALIAAQLAAGSYSQSAELIAQYFASCEAEGLNEENLSRGADMLALFSGQSGLDALRPLLPKVRAMLSDASVPPGGHREIVSCLVTIAHTAASVDDLDTVVAIGKDLEASANADRGVHGICCGASAGTLLTQADAERVLDRFMSKREDANFARFAPALLRYAGTTGAEVALSRLETEESGQNRKILMRLISQLGTSALEAARLRVKSGTWYIVRNVCTVLQDLKDPDLAQDLRPALVHEDARVQQAAFHAVTKARAANRAEVLANCLISFHPHVLELALDELTFLKDPKSLPGLIFYASNSAGKSAAIVMKTIATFRAIGGEGAMTGLGRILKDPSAPIQARRQAMEALRWSMHPTAKAQLDEFSTSPDPLAREYLAKATGR